jgi:hypothetical protein
MKKIFFVFLFVPFLLLSQNPKNGLDNFSINNALLNDYEITGISFSQNTSFSKNEIWVGPEVTLSSFYKLPNDEDMSIFVEAFVFSWSKKISTNTIQDDYNCFDFNCMRISSPLTISLIKFGFINRPDNEKNTWYYKPEIGVGFGHVSLFYSYNAFFNKVPNNIHEKHMFNIRFSKQISDTWWVKQL